MPCNLQVIFFPPLLLCFMYATQTTMLCHFLSTPLALCFISSYHNKRDRIKIISFNLPLITVDLSHSNLALAQVKNHAYYEEKTSIWTSFLQRRMWRKTPLPVLAKYGSKNLLPSPRKVLMQTYNPVSHSWKSIKQQPSNKQPNNSPINNNEE